MKTIIQSYKGIVASVLVFTSTFVFGFSVVEPQLLQAIGDQFIVTQSVTAEISFISTTSDVVMNGAIAGVTGGTSNGNTNIVVLTNNASGYSMTLQSSSSPAMQGNSQGGYISNYTPTTPGTPDYVFSVGTNTGEFAYTVSASTTADLDLSFRDNGGACGIGSSDTSGSASCWLDASTTAKTIINRTSSTPATGATTTLYFRVQITANPNPAIPQDTYTATSTLTAVTN